MAVALKQPYCPQDETFLKMKKLTVRPIKTHRKKTITCIYYVLHFTNLNLDLFFHHIFHTSLAFQVFILYCYKIEKFERVPELCMEFPEYVDDMKNEYLLEA